MEHRLGHDLWTQGFPSVTSLELNMRTKGALADILRGVRAGRLSYAAWAALKDRILRGHDPRVQPPPFTTKGLVTSGANSLLGGDGQRAGSP